jgi:hypothetical protein
MVRYPRVLWFHLGRTQAKTNETSVKLADALIIRWLACIFFAGLAISISSNEHQYSTNGAHDPQVHAGYRHDFGQRRKNCCLQPNSIGMA